MTIKGEFNGIPKQVIITNTEKSLPALFLEKLSAYEVPAVTHNHYLSSISAPHLLYFLPLSESYYSTVCLFAVPVFFYS